MLTHCADITESSTQPAVSGFDQIWGNAMQREDFLALAASLRQFNLSQANLAFLPGTTGQPVEQVAFAQE
ncbi:hypothetical protein ACIPL1_22645 [Pseudomonas sp. NPDC090202]|uniref:hypothetical protein n=1 Tax=unclassified Pseudomonas TaxID=196821 RepID=UPI0037FB36D8